MKNEQKKNLWSPVKRYSVKIVEENFFKASVSRVNKKKKMWLGSHHHSGSLC